MSEKSKGDEKRGIRKCLPAVLKALKAGFAAEELRDTEDCRKDTLYWLLDTFKDAEVIDEKKGKWYYTLALEFQNYQTEAELERHLRHSKDLLGHAARLDGDNVVIEIYALVLGTRFSLFREHIESGYSKISQDLKNVEELDKRTEAAFTRLYEAIEKAAIPLGYEVKERAKLWAEVQSRKLALGPEIESLKGALESYPREVMGTWDPIKSEYKSIYLEFYPRVYKRPGTDLIHLFNEQGEPRDFFTECKTSEEMKNLHSEFVRSEAKAKAAYNELTAALEPALRKILRGIEPLNGHCGECPKVLIGRSK